MTSAARPAPSSITSYQSPADVRLVSLRAVVHGGPHRVGCECRRGEKALLQLGCDPVFSGRGLFADGGGSQGLFGQSPFGEVEAGADVSGEVTRQTVDGLADVEYPPVVAVRVPQPILHSNGFRALKAFM
jgi:hypothetical protein